MNIEEIKHLFTPVSERLPEKTGDWIIDRDNIKFYLFINNENELSFVDYPSISGDDWYKRNYTHWLDLSTLTTKERALELAESVFFYEYDIDKRKAIEMGKLKL